MDKWIKCKDRMPNEYMDVWFSANSHPNFPFLGHFENKQFYARESCPFANVTHWMPFERPNPPEPEESELVKRIRQHSEKVYSSAIPSTIVMACISIIQDYEREHSK